MEIQDAGNASLIDQLVNQAPPMQPDRSDVKEPRPMPTCSDEPSTSLSNAPTDIHSDIEGSSNETTKLCFDIEMEEAQAPNAKDSDASLQTSHEIIKIEDLTRDSDEDMSPIHGAVSAQVDGTPAMDEQEQLRREQEEYLQQIAADGDVYSYEDGPMDGETEVGYPETSQTSSHDLFVAKTGDIDTEAEHGSGSPHNTIASETDEVPANETGRKRNHDAGSNDDYKSHQGQKKPKRSRPSAKGKKSKKDATHLINKFDQNKSFSDVVKAAESLDKPFTFQSSTRRKDAYANIQANVPSDKQQIIRKDWSRIEKAIRNFSSRGCVKPVDGKWSVKGMKTTLKNHQVISTGFVRGREKGTEEPKGGIIADEMGLGKTLTILANIVNGRRDWTSDKSNEKTPHTTLIIVPSPIQSQWFEEIEKHCEEADGKDQWGIGQVITYSDSQSKKTKPRNFYAADVVLTTYYDVRQSWPNVEFPKEMPAAEKQELFQKEVFEKRGPLHRTKFLRIVVDEGHNIRNPGSHTSQAVLNLDAEHHWVLSGTPMMNGTFDLENLWRFIKHPDAIGSVNNTRSKKSYWEEKKEQVSRPLTDRLLKCMHAFTHEDKLFGARLVVLPDASMEIRSLKMQTFHAAVYNVVKNRAKQRVQTSTDDETEGTQSMNPLAILTLLRQVSAHPLLLNDEAYEMLELEDYDLLDSVLEWEVRKSKEKGHAMTGNFKELFTKRNNAGPSQPAKSARKSKLKKARHEHKHERDLLSSLKQTKNFDRQSGRTLCPSCKLPAVEPRVTECGHVYCTNHWFELLYKNTEDGPALTACIAEGCGKVIGDASPYDDGEGDLLPRWLDSHGYVIPSAKTDAVKSQISKWLDPKHPEGDPANKIIVFTSFLGMVRILSRIFQLEGWNFVTLHGKVDKKTRDMNITKFRTDPNVKILLATLLTGGTGLNLTEANKVIQVDPFWHESGEDQAFCRIYRIGQSKETQLVKLSVEGTVDDHIQSIKERKNKEIGKVLRRHKRSKMELLMEVLGMNSHETDESDQD